jgi:AraC-like DNA-binding protein
LLPEQFYSTLRKVYHGNPERRLMAAVLEDVVACLSVDPRYCTRRQRRDFHDAKSWINAADDSDWVFSFSNICEALGIDPSYLRRGLNQWVGTCREKTDEVRRSQPDRAGVRHKHFRLRA